MATWKRVRRMGWEITWRDGWRAVLVCAARGDGWTWDIYKPGADDSEPINGGAEPYLWLAKSTAGYYHKKHAAGVE